MSDANRTAVGMVEEVVLGTTPATPAFESLRVTGASLAYAKQTGESKELRADGNLPDIITLGFQAGGDIPQEASYGALDSILRGAFRSEWVWAAIRQNITGTLTNITAVSTTTYTVAAANTTQYRNFNFAQFQLIVSSGFTAAGNNRTFVAGAASSGTSIVMTGGVVDASPIAGSRVKMIGFQGPSGDTVAVAGGIGTQGLTNTSLDFTTMNLVAGMWVYVGGPLAANAFATPGTKGFCRISSVAAHTLLFDIVPSTWAADTGTGKLINVYVGDYMRNGITPRSYTLELQYQDIAVPEFEYYVGNRVGAIQLSSPSKTILTTKTTFMGLSASNVTARFAGATDVAAPTNDVLNSSANVGFLYENGAPIAGPNFVMSTDWTINNNLRRNDAVGTAGSVAIGMGRFRVSGSLDMYYGNNAILTKIRASTASGYAVTFVDNNAIQALLFDMPRIKFGDGNPTVPGIDTDRMLPTKFDAIRHPTLGYTMHVQRFEAFNV